MTRMNVPRAISSVFCFGLVYFQWKDFQFGMDQDPFLKAGCRFTNCMTTNDRSLLNQSDALISHPINFDMNDQPLPRQPHQRYIFPILNPRPLKEFYPSFITDLKNTSIRLWRIAGTRKFIHLNIMEHFVEKTHLKLSIFCPFYFNQGLCHRTQLFFFNQ